VVALALVTATVVLVVATAPATTAMAKAMAPALTLALGYIRWVATVKLHVIAAAAKHISAPHVCQLFGYMRDRDAFAVATPGLPTSQTSAPARSVQGARLLVRSNCEQHSMIEFYFVWGRRWKPQRLPVHGLQHQWDELGALELKLQETKDHPAVPMVSAIDRRRLNRVRQDWLARAGAAATIPASPIPSSH